MRQVVDLPALSQTGPPARSGDPGRLLRPRLPAHAETPQGCGSGGGFREPAAKGNRAGAGHRSVRRVPAQGHQARRPELHRASGGRIQVRDRSRTLPAGAGHSLHGPGDARRLRGRLPGGNMPCTGCFGPTSRVRDQGAKILSAVCSSIAGKTEEEIDATLDGIPDPVGTFYRYSLGGSLLAGEPTGRIRMSARMAEQNELPSIPSPASKATGRSTSSSTSRARWKRPTSRSRSCAVSRSSA